MKNAHYKTAHQPTPVDTLIAGGTLVTMDGKRRIVRDGGLAVRGDRLVFVGSVRCV